MTSHRGRQSWQTGATASNASVNIEHEVVKFARFDLQAVNNSHDNASAPISIRRSSSQWN